MSEMTLTKTQLRDGKWQGILRTDDAQARPNIAVFFDDRPVDGVELAATDAAGEWGLVVPVPVNAISDGVQTILITDGDTGKVLNAFGIMAGEVPRDMVQAEMSLIRAELDLLKQAFRRHCAEAVE